MAGIRVNTTFTLAGMPVKTPKAEVIAAIPSLLVWGQADAATVTLSGAEITLFTDKAGGSGTFVPVASTRRALLEAGALGAYSAALFKGSTTSVDGATDCYTATGITLAEDTPYSYFAVFKPSDTGNQDCIISRFTSTTVRALLAVEITTGNLLFQHGTATITHTGLTSDEWHYAICSFDGTDLKMTVDGVDKTPVTATGQTGSASIILGAITNGGSQAFDGYISDAAIFDDDVLGDPDQKAALIDFCRLAYGL